MGKISKELIESYRKVVLPFVSKQLHKANFEGQGETDKAEFEHDFNEILNLALSSLNPSGDCISREAINSEIEKRYCSKHCVVPSEEPYCPDNCPARFLKNIVKECPTVDLWQMRQEATENALKKAEVLYGRPKGQWEIITFPHSLNKYKCNQCQHYLYSGMDRNFCPNCGADMREGQAT